MITPRALPRPRLASLHLFAGSLLVSLGIAPQVACTGDVIADGQGGSGGSGATTTATSTATGAGGGATTSTTTGTTTATTTTSSTTTGAGGAAPAPGCQNPAPILVDGQDTGVDQCENGQLRRRAALECPKGDPMYNPCCGECPEGTICDTQGEVACMCVDACHNDAECLAGNLCLCGPAGGVCVAAGCFTGADCAPDEECTSWDPTYGCLYVAFACTTPADTCGGDNDCNPGELCSVVADGHRQCGQNGCAIGRPFLVRGEARTAGLVARGDWVADALAPDLRGIDPATRADLAEAWEQTAQMEHASIAAFARFSLQLLGVGAPPELLERTTRAMADETRHARRAFALASAYRGRRVGPGALALEGAMVGASDVASVVRLVVREGCAGETIAALEASEAEAHASDEVVREVLAGITDDESEHAELAWRTVRWALATFGDDVRDAVRGELARLEAELAGAALEPTGERDERLLRAGVATPLLRAHMRREALTRAVVPCLRALVATDVRLAA
jgi:hypothetical protein